MRALARIAWERGLTPIPSKNKKPLISWGEFIYRRMTEAELNDCLRLIKDEFSIITGQLIGSKYLVVVDIDEFSALPIPVPYYATKTHRGYHIPYYSHYPLPTKKIDGIELRGEASLVIFPGSIVNGTFYDGSPEHYFNPPHVIPRAILNLFVKRKEKRKEKKMVVKSGSEVDDKEIKKLIEIIKPHYHLGNRHNIVMGVSALLRRQNVPLEKVLALFRALPDDEDRTPQVVATYNKDWDEIASYLWCPEVVEAIWASGILQKLKERYAQS